MHAMYPTQTLWVLVAQPSGTLTAELHFCLHINGRTTFLYNIYIVLLIYPIQMNGVYLDEIVLCSGSAYC